MSLVTESDYKTALGITGDGENTKLTQYAAGIDDAVKIFLGRNIESADYTDEIYDGSGTRYLVTREHPITAITKLEVYEGLDSDGSQDWEEWTQNDEYERLLIEEGEIALYMEPVFPKGKQNIRIKYTAGYLSSATPIPDDIEYVCKQLMALKYMKFDKKLLGKTSVSQSVGSSHSASYEVSEESILKQIERHRDILL